MSYGSPYDTASRTVTSLVFILFSVVAISVHSMVATAVVALALLLAYAWSPTGYSIEDGNILVRRLVGKVRIPLGGLREIRVATRDDLRFAIRIFGSGGLFGYYGIYRTSGLGKCTWYVTDRRRALVLTTAAGTYVVSPDNTEAFLGAIRSQSKPAAGTSSSASAIFSSIGSDNDQSDAGIGWVLTLVLVPVIAIVAAGMLYAPGPPQVTLTSQSLTIHDKFYPVTVDASSVDVPNVRIIDVNSDPDWQPVMRTNGFNNGRYESGWFKVSSGKKVRMYRARSTRVVLLPPKGDDGTAVLLETKDPEKFAADLQREWGSASQRTGLVSVPMPSIATSTTSPAFIRFVSPGVPV